MIVDFYAYLMTKKYSNSVKRIVILGHTGFVGNRLMEFFEGNYPDLEVVGISSRKIDLTNKQDAFKLKDYFDLTTVVIMCSGIKSNYGNDLSICSLNIKMAENVSRVLADYPVKKFLFFSSIAVYGVDVEDTSMTEETRINMDTYYGLSKYVSEEILSLALSKESSLVKFRTPTIYGPYEKIIAPTPSGFLTTYLNGGEVSLWGDGSELREFLFIEDLIKIIEALSFNDFEGVINPSNGKGHSYKEALDIISKLLGKTLKIHSKERTKEKVNKVYDTSLFKKIFPEFSFTSLENGLRYMLESEASLRTTCNLCTNDTTKKLIDLGKQPICNRFLKSPSEKEQKFNLSLGQCQLCGLVQLTDKMPAEELISRYDWVTYVEPEDHLDFLAEKMKKMPGLNNKSRILGISFKDDSLIERMNNLGFSNSKVLDLKEDLDVGEPNASIETIQAALTPKKAKEIVEKEGLFDLVIVRHILEHTYDLNDFVTALNGLLSDEGYLVFEVPDCSREMEKNNYAAIWEEHISYFTPSVFKQLFSFFGLELIYFERVPYALENSLIGIGKKGAAKNQGLLDDIELKEEKERADNFAFNFKMNKTQMQEYFASLKTKKEKIALLGAGHWACGFINFLELKDNIEFLVDDNENKKGLFMPGSKLPICDSSALAREGIDMCLLGLNPQNETKVIDKNDEFMNSGGKFFSIFPESENALPLIRDVSKMEKDSPEVFYACENIIKITKKDTDFIRDKAFSSPIKRARICLHHDIDNPLHEMIITAMKEGYVRPHRHINKSESFHMIEGEMDVVIFDEDGSITDIIEMGEYNSKKKFYYRLPTDEYHTVVVKSDYAIFHEVTNGPFNREETDFAPWSPEEKDKNGVAEFSEKVNRFGI